MGRYRIERVRTGAKSTKRDGGRTETRDDILGNDSRLPPDALKGFGAGLIDT
jgi:hypothetical protein